MIIKLSPVRSDMPLAVAKAGDQLEINGVSLDFSRLADGSTLPVEAASSSFIVAPVERVNGELVVTLMLPHAADAPENARFPIDIREPADGRVPLPGLKWVDPLVPTVGVIDWSQVITAEMKQAAAAAELLASVQAETARLRKIADDAIAPLQDAMDLGEATAEEGAELTAWKRYRVALNRLPDQPGYPNEITWPAPPA
ncbi:tail fiber assembly protein [Pseudomonas sp. CK-NBRI-02]|uniref:tail fiber assembly protein n=1 Tax=Pseudomonas sp. CK-NBRI-02 TaxID=2249759 RepID=UPI0003A88213|nr:tail fiber assembly protein [Pseudomonas sp. CK-NBRI-02]